MSNFSKLQLAEIAISIAVIVIVALWVLSNQHTISPYCISMNGNPIDPTPELCKYACNAGTTNTHMQDHYDETCTCCRAMNVDYASAAPYQPRVYVINPDGSQGEDRTCAYYPEYSECSVQITPIQKL
jgi:hypothetical protein